MCNEQRPIVKIVLAVGSVAMMVAIAAGAFGAHVLKKSLDPELMAIYQTAVQYHSYHALGLLIIGLLSLCTGFSVLLRWASLLMVVGIVLFSGSLYTLSLSGIRWLGAITPLGGIALLGAWLLLTIAILKSR